MAEQAPTPEREGFLTLEEILNKSNKKIQELYQRHKDVLSSKDIEEISRIAHLHVLKLGLGELYNDFLMKHIPGAIKEELGQSIDGRMLFLMDHPEEIPTFESYKIDKITGKSVKGEGELIEVSSVLSRNNIAKTFVTKFENKKAFRNAINGYNTIKELI